MTMQPRIVALMTGLLCTASVFAAAQPAQATIQVQVTGTVRTPGTFDVPPQGRLADAVVAAHPAPDAYLIGALFLRERERAEQLRLRAGLAHDLERLQRSSRPGVVQTAGQLAQWLGEHEPTGRVRQNVSPRLMQVQPQANPVLAHGDTLVVPSRPASIRVMGAVAAECSLKHEPLRDARDYLRDCALSDAADPDDLYVIQPDGNVQQLGIAAWNRSDPQAIAPGGTLYVPLDKSSVRKVDERFNSEFAAFIATQPIAP